MSQRQFPISRRFAADLERIAERATKAVDGGIKNSTDDRGALLLESVQELIGAIATSITDLEAENVRLRMYLERAGLVPDDAEPIITGDAPSAE